MGEEYVSEIIEEKFKKNLSNVLCDQPSYLECFDITREQCIEELTEYNVECFNKAKEKVSGPLTNKKNGEKFGTIAMMCIALNHLSIHAENAEEIAGCMEKSSFDDAAVLRSFLK